MVDDGSCISRLSPSANLMQRGGGYSAESRAGGAPQLRRGERYRKLENMDDQEVLEHDNELNRAYAASYKLG